MRRWAGHWVLATLVACGGSGPSSPPPQAAGAPAQLVMPAAGSDDVVVAMVGDRKVWGSCVATQVQRAARTGTPKTPRQALDECVDFELLGQAAEARGLATDESVIDATRTALVRRLLDDWEAKHGTATALRGEIDDLFAHATAEDIDQPERRESWHVLVHVEKPTPDVDRKAKQLADAIYAALPASSGLFVSDLEAAKTVPNPNKLPIISQAFKPIAVSEPNVAPEYKGALFALAEPGQVTPVTKTQFGYHVILLTRVEPAKHFDRTSAEPLLLSITRNATWRKYIDGLLAQHQIERHFELLGTEEGS